MLSIIMPVYNKEKYIDRTIQSVLAQTYQNFEFIVINDGSTDGSEERVKFYIEKDFRIKYVSTKNNGVANARNIGLNMMKGEYFSFIDADDTWDEMFLEKMLSKVFGKDLIFCGHYFVGDKGKSIGIKKYYKSNFLEEYLLNRCTPNTNSWLINSEFVRKSNITFDTDLNWGEDMLFFSKCLYISKSIDILEEPLTNYYINVNNSLSGNNLDKIELDLVWMKRIQSYIAEHSIDMKNIKNLNLAIENYRLPAAITYRIYKNRRELNIIKKGHLKYIYKISLINGLRSLKLIFFQVYLILFLKKGRYKVQDDD